MTFTKKLEKILQEQKNQKASVLTEEQNSPTSVHPEKGEDVTHGTIDGTGKIDATGPIKAGAEATLKTSPGDTTAGPTGHIPGNSDLPRAQHDGLDKENKNPGKKAYGLHEEGKDEDGKEKVEEEKKLPAFLQKKDSKEDDGDKKEVKEESETDDANKKAGFKAEEFDQEEGDKSKENLTKEEKDDAKEDKKTVEEATKALFKDEKLSETFKEKTATIFEATLSLRLKDYRKKLNERYSRKLNERVEEIREQLSEAVNGHLDLVVEHWVKENEVPLEKAIKAELVENFLSGFKDLCEEHYIELPDDKVDVVVEMAGRIERMEKQLNEQISTNVTLQKQVKLFERTEVFNRVSNGLAATQVEKLKSLSESVEFKSAKAFETALTTLKENALGNSDAKTQKKSEPQKTLAEQTLEQATGIETSAPGQMTSIKNAMARMVKI
jgi:hypothetical protein